MIHSLHLKSYHQRYVIRAAVKPDGIVVVEYLHTFSITVEAASIIEMNNSIKQIQRTWFYG